jgi:hypothetical protein
MATKSGVRLPAEILPPSMLPPPEGMKYTHLLIEKIIETRIPNNRRRQLPTTLIAWVSPYSHSCFSSGGYKTIITDLAQWG